MKRICSPKLSRGNVQANEANTTVQWLKTNKKVSQPIASPSYRQNHPNWQQQQQNGAQVSLEGQYSGDLSTATTAAAALRATTAIFTTEHISRQTYAVILFAYSHR
eukprot:616145_1